MILFLLHPIFFSIAVLPSIKIIAAVTLNKFSCKVVFNCFTLSFDELMCSLETCYMDVLSKIIAG